MFHTFVVVFFFSVTGLQFLNNEGSALYSVESKANHSCIPNAQATFPHANHELHLVALRDIQCGKIHILNLINAIRSFVLMAFIQLLTLLPLKRDNFHSNQVKRFVFPIWMIVYYHEAVILVKRSFAIIIYSIAPAKSVKSKNMIQMLQVMKKMTMMTTKVWMKIKITKSQNHNAIFAFINNFSNVY